MRYRYLKVSPSSIVGIDEVRVEDLVALESKHRTFDWIIDVQEGTYYDSLTNDWLTVQTEI